MKKIFLSLSALAATTLVGCGDATNNTDPNLLVSSDYETLAGWMPEAQGASLTKEKAHSGLYSIKVDSEHEYSLTYRELLGRLHSTRIKKIKVAAWVFVSSAAAQASLVTTVSSPTANEKPLLWEAVELGKTKVFGEWAEVSKVITVPEAATPNSALSLYMWRTGGTQPVYLDDIRVTIEP